MRSGALLPLLILVGGCDREKSFDQRFEDVAGDIENRADTIDRELENRVAENESESIQKAETFNDGEIGQAK